MFIPMKFIDKILKWLKTDRNTFVTYILTLISIYIAVDRLAEVTIMILSGVSVSYWGPVKYTLALACPLFAFLFSCSSSFVKSDSSKIGFFYLYCIAFYIVVISMCVQWMNLICWLLFISTPGYVSVIQDLSYLVQPAFQSLALYLPLITFYPLFKKLYTWINRTKDLKDAIMEYGGISLAAKKTSSGAYSTEMPLYKDKKTGASVTLTEDGRYQSVFICGVSGTGKTSMMFEPMMAKDIEKKHFFREATKELAYTALKSRIASLKHPYDNQYLNNNFNLNMITPNTGKEKLFKAFFKKMILSDSPNIVYRDLGFTSLSPDYESTSRILEVAENYHVPVNLIDPSNADSPGLNPFTYDDPVKIAIIISSVLKEMYTASAPQGTTEETILQNVTMQAVENVSILLKEMYPRLHDGLLPNLEDMLNMFNDFSLVEDMCHKLEEHKDLAKKYHIQLGYFKKNFYADGINRENTEKYITSAASQLDTLLRVPGVKNILCNRSNNLNYDDALANGEITLVCTRRGDLGPTVHTAFGLFILLLMQYSVLRRPGNERTRIPHFLYIDEFPDFITHATVNMFALYRKYRVGIIISAQNLSQLGEKEGKYRDTILANCANKFVFGNNTPEDNAWWEKELGASERWIYSTSYDAEKQQYDSKLGNPLLLFPANFKDGKLQSLPARSCAYKVRNAKGRSNVGEMKVDLLDAKYHDEHRGKQYNFAKFGGTPDDVVDDEETTKKKKKFDLKKIEFKEDDNGEVDPIKHNTTDSSFLLNNDDAIIFDIRRDGKKTP